ncbi:hypothetical protein [Gimesia fumaroli]|uniref:Uncharacterized protein n=1 Tax=Gimesia fumaroli TaxID=2527976 RepID=A0A518IG36_9PLAN|nr:hypothetical protein [Gimesia fumaroli]QDV52057.1 hypothetical protein Enr17x_41160 [Gimesia fumaroli]
MLPRFRLIDPLRLFPRLIPGLKPGFRLPFRLADPRRLLPGLKPGVRSRFRELELKPDDPERDRVLLPGRNPGFLLLLLLRGREENEFREEPDRLLRDEFPGLDGRRVDRLIRLEPEPNERDEPAFRGRLLLCEGALRLEEKLPREKELPPEDRERENPLDRLPLLRDIRPEELPLDERPLEWLPPPRDILPPRLPPPRLPPPRPPRWAKLSSSLINITESNVKVKTVNCFISHTFSISERNLIDLYCAGHERGKERVHLLEVRKNNCVQQFLFEIESSK